MLAGLVPVIATELGVPPLAAGSLTSAFAAGMVVGAPSMALVARRWPARPTLTAFLALFVLAHVVGALTPSFGVLLATRIVAALANAGFLAVALAVAVRIAPAGRTARATATLLAGTTLALVVGVPAGAAVGHALGWRATFWAVAAVATVALLAVPAGVPRETGTTGTTPGVGRELIALRRAPVVAALVAGALVNGGTFAAHTYLASVLDAAGVPVPAGLAVFGVGAFAGVTVAARFADARPRGLVTTGLVVLVLGWTTLATADGAIRILLLGPVAAAAFAVGSTLVARTLALATGAPALAGGTATAALNLGATLGPLLGGAALAVAGPAGPLWAALGLVLLAVPVAGPALGERRSAADGS
ncbi:MFS transporter [Pseudonocardia sp. HH130630-07]|uniref:MFS transporter n=1 Tax=Pseudonocardia sp. HH130630-07 TaxID=1690815 RepID=UPI0008151E67|nr:hypothetical protein AFB00_25240 [Pseudonocardia sp. HH130630-07]